MGLLEGLILKSYTLGDLMNIDGTRQQKANACSVELVKVYHELRPKSILDKFKAFFGKKNILNTYYVIFKFSVKSDTGQEHVVFIKTNPDFNLQNWDNNKAQVFCDCADFKYRSAYSLNQHNSLFLNDKTKLSLGPALTTAPKRMQPTLLCKHSYAAVQWLVNNYSNVMQTI